MRSPHPCWQNCAPCMAPPFRSTCLWLRSRLSAQGQVRSPGHCGGPFGCRRGARRSEGVGFPWCCLGAGSDLLVPMRDTPAPWVRLGEAFCYLEACSWSRIQGAPGLGSGWLEGSPVARGVIAAAGAGLSWPGWPRRLRRPEWPGWNLPVVFQGRWGAEWPRTPGLTAGRWLMSLPKCGWRRQIGVRWVAAGELQWEYRHCRLPAGALVTAARFRLERDDPAAVLERNRSILKMRSSVQPQGVLTFAVPSRTHQEERRDACSRGRVERRAAG